MISSEPMRIWRRRRTLLLALLDGGRFHHLCGVDLSRRGNIVLALQAVEWRRDFGRPWPCGTGLLLHWYGKKRSDVPGLLVGSQRRTHSLLDKKKY